MTATKRQPRRHIGESKDPRTGKRVRKRHEKRKEARLYSARALIDHTDRTEILGTTTFAQAAAKVHELLVLENGNDPANNKHKRLARYLKYHIAPLEIAPGELLINQQLRLLTREDILSAYAALEAIPSSDKVKYTAIAFVCEVLRAGFGKLAAPIMFPADIPGAVKKAPFGTAGIRQSRKPIPLKPDIDRRFESASGPLRILLVLLVYFGLRISEALEVRRIDLDFKPADEVSWLKVRGTKTGAADRWVPMSDIARGMLLEWVDRIDGDLHWQVISDNDAVSYSESMMRDRYSALETLIGGSRFTFHQFRAYFVTAALAGGVGMRDITAWIGHAHMSTTVRYYAGAILLAYEIWKERSSALQLEAFTNGLRVGKTPLQIVQSPASDAGSVAAR